MGVTADYDAMSEVPAFGLRYWEGSREIRLIQISGGTKIRLLEVSIGKSWWTRLPKDTPWEIYEATSGRHFPNVETANQVLATLSGKKDRPTP
jgi:hypothetical protein